MKQTWACFMFLVWTQSLEDRRRALWVAEAVHEGNPLAVTEPEVWAKEAKVNRALVKRNKWKKRACENCRTRVQRLGS